MLRNIQVLRSAQLFDAFATSFWVRLGAVLRYDLVYCCVHEVPGERSYGP